MIPCFPEFIPVSLDLHDELVPFFNGIQNGMCENTFATLFLDSFRYHYVVSRYNGQCYLTKGEIRGVHFLHIYGEFPSDDDFRALIAHPALAECRCLTLIPEDVAKERAAFFDSLSLPVMLGKDSSDYIYERAALAELKGKAYHKKKNLVNQFLRDYEGRVEPVSEKNVGDAVSVLESWKASRLVRGEDEGDFVQCSCALRHLQELGLSGIIVYADGQPAGFSLGERLGKRTMYDVHFEKGVDSVHGIYQALNWYAARSLPEDITLINREQDLGDAGLRQAKQSYRPCGMVNKYWIFLIPLEKAIMSWYNMEGLEKIY